jgi:hypothetical protein
MHLTLLVAASTAETAAVLLLAGRSASRAASGFIGESFFGEKVLLGSRKNESGTAIAAR